MVKLSKSTCLFCSLGCGLAYRCDGENLTAIDYDKENPVNHGSLCPRGYYNFELLNHPKKLIEPFIGERKVPWADADRRIKDGLKKYKGDEVGILVSMNATNEDAYVAAKMAKDIGTKNISAAGEASDIEAFQGTKWGAPAIHGTDAQRIGEFNALLIIGDILTRSPVLSKRINKVKYGKRGNRVIVVDPNVSHTSWFATDHLKIKPGTEAALMAGMLKVIAEENKRPPVDIDLKRVAEITGISEGSMIKAAKSFDGAETGCVIFTPSSGTQRNDLVQYLMNMIASYSIEKKHITFFSYGNTIGVNNVIDAEVPDHVSLDGILSKTRSGAIKALFMFGEDIPGVEAPLLIKSVFFKGEKLDPDSVLLPLASYLERKGNITMAGGRPVNLVPIAHKIGGRAIWKMISSIMDYGMSFGKIVEDTAKVKPRAGSADLKEKTHEALSIRADEKAEPMNITHFGNNELVKNFFWWRVSNG